jgi:hypothetical protein
MDSALDAIIMVTCRGPEVHAAALITDDPPAIFSAHCNRGVFIDNRLEGEPSDWYAVDTGVEVTPEAVRWAKAEVGQRYDWLAAIESGFEREALEAPAPEHLQALFCSYAVDEMARRCALALGIEKPNPVILAAESFRRCFPRWEIPAALFLPKGVQV